MPEALDLLKTRRSVKPLDLAGPGPSATDLETLLTIAARVPDHGKLVPWRFVVFEGDARLKAGEAIVAAFKTNNPQATSDQIEFERRRLARAPLVVAVVSRAARENPRVGTGALLRRRRHEPGARGPCARLCGELDHGMVRL